MSAVLLVLVVLNSELYLLLRVSLNVPILNKLKECLTIAGIAPTTFGLQDYIKRVKRPSMLGRITQEAH